MWFCNEIIDIFYYSWHAGQIFRRSKEIFSYLFGQKLIQQSTIFSLQDDVGSFLKSEKKRFVVLQWNSWQMSIFSCIVGKRDNKIRAHLVTQNWIEMTTRLLKTCLWTCQVYFVYRVHNQSSYFTVSDTYRVWKQITVKPLIMSLL